MYWSLILFVLESGWYGWELMKAWEQEVIWKILFWLSFFIFSFVHIFLVLMDGWSRYQDYKRAKDQFYLYGFRGRIADLYIRSKCQRMAAQVAAEELGMREQIDAHYQKKGVEWFHFIPYFMVKDPWFMFRRHFWKRTFMEKHYTPKVNFKELSLQQQIL